MPVRNRALAALLTLMMLMTMMVAAPLTANAGTQAVQNITFAFQNATVVVNGTSIGSNQTIQTDSNGDITFTVTPDSGYSLNRIIADPNVTANPTGNPNEYEFTGLTSNTYVTVGIAPRTITFYAINGTITVGGTTILDGQTGTAVTNSVGDLSFTVNPDTNMSLLGVTSNENQGGARESLDIERAGNSFSIDAATFDGEVYVIYWPKTPSSTPSFGNHTGNVDDPYVISSLGDLQQLSADVYGGYTYAGKYFQLTADIDLNGAANNPWVPIGGGAGDYSFEGTFNGNGHTISDLYYNYVSGYWSRGNTIMNNVGLFGKVNVGGAVRNLTLADGSITSQRSVGAIVGKNWGTVDNCTNAGVTVTGTESEGTGGVVGSSWVNFHEGDSGYDVPTVSNCTNAASVTSDYSRAAVGGIIGENEGYVYNCSNSGTIEADYNNAGGIVGSNEEASPDSGGGYVSDGYVNNSYNSGAITANTAGGIVGFQELRAQNVYNYGTITGTNTNPNYAGVGEIIGELGSYVGASWNDFLYYRVDANGDPLLPVVGAGNNSYNGSESGGNFGYADPAGLEDLLTLLNDWVDDIGSPYRSWDADIDGHPVLV
jgi:hypothetical protein